MALQAPTLDGPCVPQGPGGRLRPLAFDAVRLDGGFFGGWQRLNREQVIPHLWTQLEASGVMDNFRAVAGLVDCPHRGFNFADSDLYKTLEAVAWEAGRLPGAEPWESKARDAIDLLRAAQRDDGYLHTHVQLTDPAGAFAELRWSHELYVLGHLLQAAVARARTTGRTDLLDVARRYAELVDRIFDAERQDGDRPACDGHPEVETALVELYRLTGERRWLDLARRQLAARGDGRLGTGPFEAAYHQDHVPLKDAHDVAGHAVRQVYLAAGAADVALELGNDPDPECAEEAATLRAALLRLWDSAEQTRTYVTGGIGSRHRDESFGDPYELSPERAYAETCAAIGVVHWAWRMLLLTGQARFADAIERALYNAVTAGLGRDGRSFFYSNPLQLRTGHDGSSEYSPGVRLPWFACACCPPNLARLAASLHSYLATSSDDGIQLHLYAAGDLDVPTDGGAVRLRIETQYPWSGRVSISAVADPLTVPLMLRVPGWADAARVTLTADGSPVALAVTNGYAVVPASAEDPVRAVVLDLPMPVEALTAHPHVDAVRGCVAIRRGPVVYCLEQVDLPDGVVLENVALVPGTTLTAEEAQVGDAGPVVVRAHGVHQPAEGSPPWRASAAVPTMPAATERGRSVDLALVPYHAWGERRPGAMRVWLPVATVTP